MSVDLNQLSDADLMALQKKDLNSMSDAGLQILAGQKAPQAKVPNQFASNEGGAAFGRPNVRGQLNVQTEPRPLESFGAGATKSMIVDPVLGVTQLASGGNLGRDSAKRYQEEGQVYSDANPKSYFGGQVAGAVLPTAKVGSAIGKIPSAERIGATALNQVPSKFAPLVDKVATGMGYGAVGSAFSPDTEGQTAEETMGNRLGKMLLDTSIGGAIPAVAKSWEPIKKAGAKIGSEMLGLTTGVGGENVRQAYQAGKKGVTEFLENMDGKSPRDILESAQGALATMKQNRRDAFEQGFESTKKNQVFLDFKPIEDKFNQTVKNLEHTGVNNVSVAKVGEKTMAEVNKVKSLISEWKRKPEVHTAEGLDALKRRIDDLWSNDMSNEAKSIITQTRGVVKNTIAKQDKNYAKTMKDYEEGLALERDIEQALGLGGKSSTNAAITKLQSLGRNNVNTNYGFRQELADTMKKETGVDLMPAIAGQSMNSYVPRGLNRVTGTLSLATPSLWATLPLQSPKLMGKALYKMGETSNKLPSAKMTDEQKKLAELLMQQTIMKSKEE